MGQTLLDKIWSTHVVRSEKSGTDLLYIDLQLLHEVTSPQAFDGLRMNQRQVRRPELCIATADHDVPTTPGPVEDPIAAAQLAALDNNTKQFGITCFSRGHENQGVVHVIGPELGLTQPGMTIVCGDSHTATHGAFGALAFGIGTSEVEHVLATQTLTQKKPKSMAITVTNRLREGVSAKDLILHIIGTIGTGGGFGYVIEYRGEAIEALSMEERMTVCNMSIEGGARAGMIAPDDKTIEYLIGKKFAPAGTLLDEAISYWKTLYSDDDCTFDNEVVIDAAAIEPHVSWGTNPAQVIPISGSIPSPDELQDSSLVNAAKRAIEYMDLKPGTPIRDVQVDTVFIGSCTNGRIEDLISAANVLRGRKKADWITGIVVPGSEGVRRRAEQMGLDKVFEDAGLQWRLAGCSMCLGMNPDQLSVGQRCASTSNRNFEGRQGKGGRTHLVSPAVAAATAIRGHFATPEELDA